MDLLRRSIPASASFYQPGRKFIMKTRAGAHLKEVLAGVPNLYVWARLQRPPARMRKTTSEIVDSARILTLR